MARASGHADVLRGAFPACTSQGTQLRAAFLPLYLGAGKIR